MIAPMPMTATASMSITATTPMPMTATVPLPMPAYHVNGRGVDWMDGMAGRDKQSKYIVLI